MFECLAVARAGAHHESLILVIGGCVVGQRVIHAHHTPLAVRMLLAPSGRIRHVREVAAYNLPLRALFDKDQGGSAIGSYRLAVLGGTPEHVVSIHYPHSIVVNAAR